MANNENISILLFSNKDFLLEALTALGCYNLSIAKDLKEFIAKASEQDFLILDEQILTVNDSSLIEQQIQDTLFWVKPAIILGNYQQENDRLNQNLSCFYQSKPFYILELKLRINQLLLVDKVPIKSKSLGDYAIFYPTLRLVIRNKGNSKGSKIYLTEKENYLLEYLLANPNQSHPTQFLLKEIWKHSTCLESHTLETHIYRLKKKIPEIAEFIFNVNDGYGIKN